MKSTAKGGIKPIEKLTTRKENSMDVIFIAGKSAVGKDTFFQNITDKKYNKIIPYTTRPKRSNEVDGVDYHFISDKTVLNHEDIAAMAQYHPAIGGTWTFIIDKKSFIEDKINVVIAPPSMIKTIQETMGVTGTIIYLYTFAHSRISRMLNRDTSSAAISESCRRYLADEKDFKEYYDRCNSKEFCNVLSEHEVYQYMCVTFTRHEVNNLMDIIYSTAKTEG
ncbi:MAG: hypothetical protein Q4F95_02235 [Oscillospiraceae bacterium]|nr:hypothetical protein [Oscillospiraceae bacterium]